MLCMCKTEVRCVKFFNHEIIKPILKLQNLLTVCLKIYQCNHSRVHVHLYRVYNNFSRGAHYQKLVASTGWGSRLRVCVEAPLFPQWYQVQWNRVPLGVGPSIMTTESPGRNTCPSKVSPSRESTMGSTTDLDRARREKKPFFYCRIVANHPIKCFGESYCSWVSF